MGKEMLLPNGNGAFVDQTKITDYLLSLSHPDGRNKAKFFLGFGFKVDEWQQFADALKEVGISNPVVNFVESVYGVRLHCRRIDKDTGWLYPEDSDYMVHGTPTF